MNFYLWKTCKQIEKQKKKLQRAQQSTFKYKSNDRTVTRTHGLVGYDTTLTRSGPRVRIPLGVMVLQ